MQEKVLVVPRSDLFPNETFQGLFKDDPQKFLSIITQNCFFMDRKQAEEDPTHKQIIPYVILCYAGKIFTVKRLSTQGEARLHHKVSIGLGGHINPEDSEVNLATGVKLPWIGGMERELSEELSVDEPWTPELVGLINDDTVPVGRVHLGLVYRVDLAHGKVTIQEKDKMEGSFLTPLEAAQYYNQMETWSQISFAAFWPDATPSGNKRFASL